MKISVMKKLHSNEDNIIKSISDKLGKSIDSLSLYDTLKGDIGGTLLSDSIKEISNKVETLLEGSKDIDLKLFLDRIIAIQK